MAADGASEAVPDKFRDILTSARTIAVVGASQKAGRDSRAITGYLIQHGYDVYPINPGHAGEKLFGRTIYATLADVPVPIDIVDIFRRSDAIPTVVDEAPTITGLRSASLNIRSKARTSETSMAKSSAADFGG